MKRAPLKMTFASGRTSETPDEGRLWSTMIDLLLVDLQLPLAELVWI
jgi:hypothetical protein